MRRLEVWRRGERLGQEAGISIGTAVVAAEEGGKGGKKDNVDDNDGSDDEKNSGEDLEKGREEGGEEEGRGGEEEEWGVGRDEEPPKYDAVGLNEKGEMINAPCPLYPPRAKSVANGLAMNMGVCW